jgi:23S rRNA (uracil1939-C5)-methyltransferase
VSEITGRVETAGSGAWHEVTAGDGRRLRVRFVIPGELVRVSEREDDPGHGDLLEVLEPSPHRRRAECRHFGPCGGCQLQHVTPAHQRSLRADRLRELLLGLDLGDAADELVVVDSTSPLAYRSRARFQAGTGPDGSRRLGFHATGGRRTVDVRECPLLTPELQAAWETLRRALTELAPSGLTGLEVTALPGSSDVLVMLNPRDRAPEPWPGIGEELIAQGAASGACVRLGKNDERPRRLGVAAALGRSPAGRPVAAPLGGFVQGNLPGADRLCDELVRLAEPEGRRVLELHAGAGLLSHALAEAGAEVGAFELDELSVAAAALLPPPSRGTLELRTGEAERAFEEHGHDAEVLVTDPPRSGLGNLAGKIAERGPERLVGIWCSLDGLERDLRVLAKAYAIGAVSLLDLFTQTRHCEVVVRFDRRMAASPGA